MKLKLTVFALLICGGIILSSNILSKAESGKEALSNVSFKNDINTTDYDLIYYEDVVLDKKTDYSNKKVYFAGEVKITKDVTINNSEIFIAGNLLIDSGCLYLNLNGKLEVLGDVYVDSGVSTNVNSLFTIHGDLRLSRNYYTGYGKLIIDGDFIIENDEYRFTLNFDIHIKCNLVINGELLIGNNLYVEKDCIINSNGTFDLETEDSKFTVNGNIQNDSDCDIIVKCGTVTLNGNYKQTTEQRFEIQMYAIMELYGDDIQYIEYQNYYKLHFTNLYINKSMDKYIIDNDPDYPRYISYLNCIPVNKDSCTDIECTFHNCKKHMITSLTCDDCNIKSCASTRIWTNLYFEEEKDIVKPAYTKYYGYQGVYRPTGNFGKSYIDMVVSCSFGDIPIARTYNSLDYSNTSSVGNGFTLNYSMHMEFDEEIPSLVYVVLTNGETWSFRYDGINYFAIDTRQKLYKTEDGYLLETRNNYSYKFNSYGYLEYIENEKSKIEIKTDLYGNIKSISEDSIVLVDFIYNKYGKIIYIKDNISNKSVYYEYDNELLIGVKNAYGYNTSYNYNNGLLKNEIDHKGNVIFKLGYYSYSGMVGSFVDEYQNRTEYEYYNKYTRVVNPDGKIYNAKFDNNFAITTCPFYMVDFGMQDRYRYNMDGGFYDYNRFNEVTWSYHKSSGSIYYSYDDRGNITSIDYDDGVYEIYTYDAANNVTSYYKSNYKTSYINKDNNMKVTKILDGTSYIKNPVSLILIEK